MLAALVLLQEKVVCILVILVSGGPEGRAALTGRVITGTSTGLMVEGFFRVFYRKHCLV